MEETVSELGLTERTDQHARQKEQHEQSPKGIKRQLHVFNNQSPTLTQQTQEKQFGINGQRTLDNKTKSLTSF